MWKFHKKTFFVCLLIALVLWGWFDVRRRGYPYPGAPEEHKTDLTVYTEAGAAFFDGRPPYEVANPRGWTYLYPPLFALTLAPLHPLASQNQVFAWFLISLLFCWGCWRECRRIVAIVCVEDSRVAAAWARWARWLGAAAILVALLPALNCLQRGQVGVVKLYFLLLGLRCILAGRGYRAWLAGGVVLALPIVLKILPAFQVGFLLFLLFVDVVRSYWNARRRLVTASQDRVSAQNTCPPQWTWVARRFSFSTGGVALGLVLFFLLIPAALLGWRANLRHLDTWAKFVLTKADDGGMGPRSGNSHSSRNQSLHNAAYRLGNFVAYVFGDGLDDRLVENFGAPKMAMDDPAVEKVLLAAQAMLALALLALGVRLVHGDGNRLNLAVGFALATVAMLVVSPVARGHYFLLIAPAVLLVPLWLDRCGRPRAGLVLAVIPPVFSVLHYVFLPYAGRVGLLGMSTTVWLMATLVVMARADRQWRAARLRMAPGSIASLEKAA